VIPAGDLAAIRARRLKLLQQPSWTDAEAAYLTDVGQLLNAYERLSAREMSALDYANSLAAAVPTEAPPPAWLPPMEDGTPQDDPRVLIRAFAARIDAMERHMTERLDSLALALAGRSKR
jgi:hypothetical protein